MKGGALSDVVRGVVKDSRSYETTVPCDANNSFQVTQLNAMMIAQRVFNIEAPAGNAEELF